jgi:hypothetical protein
MYDKLAQQEYINYMAGKKDIKEGYESLGLGTQGVTQARLNQADTNLLTSSKENEEARKKELDELRRQQRGW